MPDESTAKVACRTYDPRRRNWHTEQLSPEGMQERRATGYGCITEAHAKGVANVIKAMEEAARQPPAVPLGPSETNVWDHGQFAPSAT